MARERWQVLLDHAMRHVQGLPQRYALGGGTVLRLFYDHRDSNDIDIFLFDPQLLAYVSPRTNDTLEDAMSDYLETEYFTKLKFPEGEIDFIPAANLTGLMPEPRAVDGHTLPVEHPVEIIAKKVHYRLKHFKSRDIFDLLTVYKFAREALCGKKSFFEPYINALRERCQLLLESGLFLQEVRHFHILPGGEEIMREYETLLHGFYENFSPDTAVNPFYSASNMAHLRRGAEALDAGLGVEHELRGEE